jgi:hypothetical protein
MTNFRLLFEQTVNRLRKVAWTSLFRFPFGHCANRSVSFVCLLINLYVAVSTYTYIFTENGTSVKLQLLSVYCKRKIETAYFRLFAANGNEKGCLFFMADNEDCCF